MDEQSATQHAKNGPTRMRNATICPPVPSRVPASSILLILDAASLHRDKLLHALTYLLRTTHALKPELHTPNRTLRCIGIRWMGISRLSRTGRATRKTTKTRSCGTARSFPHSRPCARSGFLIDACTEKFEEQGLGMQDGKGVEWLYTDPADGKQEIVAQPEDEIVAEDIASLVHEGDAEEVK
ncbi:hypothetical protein EVJ58_g2873 [Rhodofomes roseus]|uniref:Uncharacterized protein n=1 Tax=Rhodofomes roseus TaxID=34475 RepID=A0A4Y9YQV7_9APHY|nr:hypothetical protein EVJ58_g2873 [Rhodofomes roseus]